MFEMPPCAGGGPMGRLAVAAVFAFGRRMANGLWANRITGHADVDPSQLLASPQNFRRHPGPQQDALQGLIDQIGYLDPVLVQKNTDVVIDGHLRVELALRTNQPTIPVTYVDLTDDEAALALATIDPVSAMAYHDAEQLDALLREVITDDAAVQALIDSLSSDVSGIEFKEFDESIEQTVEYHDCPECGHRWPK